MNSLTSPELLEKVNPSNQRLQVDFLNYLNSVQRSPGTIAGYKNDLNIVFVWNLLKNGDKPFEKITKRDYISLQNWLVNENGNSPSRVRRVKSAISSLGNYIENILDEEEEYQNFRSIVRKIESPANVAVRRNSVFSYEQLEDLLQHLVSKGKIEQACAAALAIYSGRRKSELLRFRVADFDDTNLVCDGALYKTSDKLKTKGTGLGKYIYCYTLAKDFKPYFDLWMAERESRGIESEWLFPSRTDSASPRTISALNNWAASFSSYLGEPWYWHSMRHFFTSRLIRAGIPEGVVQEIMGWSSADMVKVYTDIDAEERIGMYFGDGGIKEVAGAKTLGDI